MYDSFLSFCNFQEANANTNQDRSLPLLLTYFQLNISHETKRFYSASPRSKREMNILIFNEEKGESEENKTFRKNAFSEILTLTLKLCLHFQSTIATM
jgi:hypothetical protein